MKLIHHAKDPCRCLEKLHEYERGLAEGVVLGVGSIMECDCGQRYKLTDNQREGPLWMRINPMVPGIGLSVAPSETIYDLGQP